MSALVHTDTVVTSLLFLQLLNFTRPCTYHIFHLHSACMLGKAPDVHAKPDYKYFWPLSGRYISVCHEKFMIE